MRVSDLFTDMQMLNKICSMGSIKHINVTNAMLLLNPVFVVVDIVVSADVCKISFTWG